MVSKRALILAVLIPVTCLALVILYNLPAVQERAAWRMEALQARVKYALNPPEQAVFVPRSTPDLAIPVTLWPSATASPRPTATPTVAGPTETPIPSATVTPTPTSIPPRAVLAGITHMYQMWNNCGPANLAMELSYWGWKGDQREPAAFMKPNPRDKNVMPYEMVDFVEEQTDLHALTRVGGDLALLKAFISAGFPVIVEKGFEGANFDGWMGHYEVVSGYDDASQNFVVQDSYKGPDIWIEGAELLREWRAFNFTYIVVYPSEREAQALAILGPQADPTGNYQYAAQLAAQETGSLEGRDLFFAWYNRGTNLVYLHDYAAAATAYDAAFAHYASLAEKERPWRIVWYQTGPYFAYFYSQRYQDVIELANTTLKAMSEPVLEESYYWRAKAKGALGDLEGAIEDYRNSLKQHADFAPALDELRNLGVEP